MLLTLPKLKPIRQYIDTIAVFKGLNRNVIVTQGELTDTYNMSCRNLPVLSTRKPRKIVKEEQTDVYIPYLYSFDKLAYVTYSNEQSRFYYGDSIETACEIFTTAWQDSPVNVVCQFQNKLCFFNMQGALVEAPLVVYDTVTQLSEWVDAPFLTDSTVYAHRIFGCHKNTVYACVHDNVLDWTTFYQNGTALTSGAWQQSFSLKSNFTACITYKNHALFFTGDEMFELYGKDASQFDMVKICDIGCVSSGAVCEIGGVLYFVSKMGVMTYTGGMPVCISQPLCEEMVYAQYQTNATKQYRAALGGDIRTLYVKLSHIENGNTVNRLYTYDTIHQTWAMEDHCDLISFAVHNNELYATDGHSIYQTYDGSEVFPWHFQTESFHEYRQNKKIHSRLSLRFCPKYSTQLQILVSYDGGEFELLSTIYADCLKTYTIPISLKACDSFQLRVCGTGEADIYYIQRIYSLGGCR